MSHVAMSLTSSGGVVICYVLLGFMDDIMFAHNGPYSILQHRVESDVYECLVASCDYWKSAKKVLVGYASRPSINKNKIGHIFALSKLGSKCMQQIGS